MAIEGVKNLIMPPARPALSCSFRSLLMVLISRAKWRRYRRSHHYGKRETVETVASEIDSIPDSAYVLIAGVRLYSPSYDNAPGTPSSCILPSTQRDLLRSHDTLHLPCHSSRLREHALEEGGKQRPSPLRRERGRPRRRFGRLAGMASGGPKRVVTE